MCNDTLGKLIEKRVDYKILSNYKSKYENEYMYACA